MSSDAEKMYDKIMYDNDESHKSESSEEDDENYF